MSYEEFLTPEQMAKTGYYDRLKVHRGASTGEIEEAYKRERERYRQFILKHTTYTRCYYLIEEAYNMLKDPEFRKSLNYAELELIPQQKEEKKKADKANIVKWIVAIVITHFLVGVIAYNSPPPGKSALNTGIACLVLGIVVTGSMAKSKQVRNAGIMAVLTITLIVNVGISWFNFRKHKVYFDNQNNFEVMIKVDGKKHITVAPYGFITNAIRMGDHRIEAYKMPGDSLLESFDVSIGDQNRYMYNVLSSGKYITGTESYSENAFLDYLDGVSAPDYPMVTVSERWMLMNYDYVFSKPPQEITVEQNYFERQTAERDYILRAGTNDSDYW